MAEAAAEDCTLHYEARFGPIARRLHRLARCVRWYTEPVLGRSRRIFVEIHWRLGDEVMALPVYEALARTYPTARLHVLCNHPELLEDNPHVYSVVEGLHAPARYIMLRDAARAVPRMAHYARLAGVPVPTSRPRLYFAHWDAPQLRRLDPDRPIVAVSAGATWATKRWPLARWRALCARLEAAGCCVVELGRGGEAIGARVNLVDATTVREAACVLHAADLFIGSDSGLMHLALAAGTPALALFGPTDPAILVGDEPALHVLDNARDCKYCWNRSQEMESPGLCPRGVAECLDPIEVDTVYARARALLEGAPR